MKFTTTLATVFGLLAVLLPLGCLSVGPAAASSTGEFHVQSSNMNNGDVWALNRDIILTFNNSIDFDSVNFSSIVIAGVSSAGVAPVTGTFELIPGTDNTGLVFHPSCPTNEDSTDGGLVPGGIEYQLYLPTHADSSTVLRDTDGRPLSVGLSRTFVTPTPPSEPLFLDLVLGAPQVLSVDFPTGLNLLSDPTPEIRLVFNQPIDARPSNLNDTNIRVLFSSETRTALAGGTPTFDPGANRVPGQLILLENCTGEGAEVLFRVTGVLPADRYIKVVVDASFADLSGQQNLADTESALHSVPSTAEYYAATDGRLGGVVDDQVAAYDEINLWFADSVVEDADAALYLPPAEWSSGGIQASFDFPGIFMPPTANLQIANGTYVLMNTSNPLAELTSVDGQRFPVVNGVVYLHDFYLEAGSTLEVSGDYPFIIYATGQVQIDGKIDVSGQNSEWVTGLQSPQYPQGGAKGVCGGGDGGTSSLNTTTETPRGEPGYGAFQNEGGGGRGGETVLNNYGNQSARQLEGLVSGGGGGGGFALTANEAYDWPEWLGHDTPGGDPRVSDHTHGSYGPVMGPEPGNRGTNWTGKAGYGMEDVSADTVPKDTAWDPQAFDFGDPSKGPDGGEGGPSVFTKTATTDDDFFGARLDDTTVPPSIIVGELAQPWAGGGGGASGDSDLIKKVDIDGDGTVEANWWECYPDPDFANFPYGGGLSTIEYRRGCPGGGGGGQLQIMAIGPIAISGEVHTDGGSGHAGESLLYDDRQVSGSGGGAGGHLILHTATHLDLSGVDLATMGEKTLTSIGGRRGWAASQSGDTPRTGGALGHNFGNGDHQIGRGGGGANGVIQIHVPNPLTDISWPVGIDPATINTMADVETALDQIASPKPYALIPFFSAGSQTQSDWVDIGLPVLRDRDPVALPGTYPDFADATPGGYMFSGVDLAGAAEDLGKVLTSSDAVLAGPAFASGSSSVATVDHYSVVLSGAAGLFPAWAIRGPSLLKGHNFAPNTAFVSNMTIVDADYDATSDTMTLTTQQADGSMVFLAATAAFWEVSPAFFRIDTTGVKGRLPSTAFVKIEWDGTTEDAPGSNQPDEANSYSTINGAWTPDPADLAGMRFIKFRITFDIAASGSDVTLSSERPVVDHIKLPYAW